MPKTYEVGPVVGVGEVLWDNFPDGRQLGGAPANFAHHVSQQGLTGRLVSSVGEDSAGDDLQKALADRGLPTEHVQRHATPTGRVDVELDDEGKPTYTIAKPAAWDHVRFGRGVQEQAKQAACICFGTLFQRSPKGRAVAVTMLETSPAECLRVFDVNLRPPHVDEQVVRECMPLTSVLKLSDEELPEIARMLGLPGTTEAFGDAVIDRFNLKLLILTRGGEGSLLRTPKQTHEHPGVEVDVVSTVGAGDSFTAGVVGGWLTGMQLADLHDHASRLSAFVCTQPGAMPELPGEFKIAT